MNQALYAHMNNKRKMKTKIARIYKELKNLNSNRTNYQPATQLINGKLTDNCPIKNYQ
jgi:hypothetical protein